MGERLERLVSRFEGLGLLEILGSDSVPIARAKGKDGYAEEDYRPLAVDLPLPPGKRLRATFYTDRGHFEQFQALGREQRTAREITYLRGELATSYRYAFLVMFGAVLLVATTLGIFIARRTTKRVSVLAAATRSVAAGDLETRVPASSKDEIGELAAAFNEMVLELRESRGRIAYLEKIGAWQEIARRLAHEIKNPLTPIQLAVQQLDRGYHGDDQAFRKLLDDATDIITEEVDGLRRLVQAFSAFAKLPNVQPERVELNSVIEDFQKSHSEIAERARLSWRPLGEPCLVDVDRMLIKHVLYNLVENAVQAGEGGQINDLHLEISATHSASRRAVVVEVRDNGPGMTPETAERVFEPYFTTKEQGTGLGLAIVKKIILEHHGTISVSSRPGQGTVFRIALPAAAEL
jgi:nitrogen fixation/metabolism regulation signal transduction histidine kinase